MPGMEICLRGENEMFVNDNKTKLAQTYTGTMSNLYFQFLSRKKSANPADQDRNRRANFAQKSPKIDHTKKGPFLFFENLAVFRYPQKPYNRIF